MHSMWKQYEPYDCVRWTESEAFDLHSRLLGFYAAQNGERQ